MLPKVKKEEADQKEKNKSTKNKLQVNSFMGLKTYIKRKLMSLRDIFKDENDINEKNVVGFAAFMVMVVFAAVDIVTGISGKHLEIQEYIYKR